ncbi:MAG: hypothetical protein IJP18_07160 [Oscillospiraceae bacterium]|nr:hypothetical protein [Oscillospiraceae bacterium]MBQ9982332.1 hypothetical protein [Oscillospiraceae bacterium]
MELYLWNLLANSAPLTGDTRDIKLPIIIAIIAVILIVLSVALSSKSKDKK